MVQSLAEDRAEVYRRIVAAAVLAPSAENTQPWRFVVHDDALMVCLDRTRTLASDIDDMLSLTAIGACIENAVVAAAACGLRSSVSLVDPVPTDKNPTSAAIAQVHFSAQVHLSVESGYEVLADCIESRCTCRRLDHRRLIEGSLLSELQQSSEGLSNVVVHWVDRRRLRQFAKLVGIGNRIRLEHQPFHQELYDNLRFTANEAARTRDGLDVATLQLPRGLTRLLSALRAWPRMKRANLLGFSRSVARQAAHEVRHSGAVGFLTVPGPEARAFVEGGRAMERIWLTATRLGLGFHPTASLPVFLAHARTGGRGLLPYHQRLTADMSERFYQAFPEVTGRAVQMAFRIGYVSEAPLVRSLRRKVEDVLRFG